MGKCIPLEENYYRIKLPVISKNTYLEIVEKICSNKKIKKNSNSKYKLLNLTRQNEIKKTDIKTFISFALSICPCCHYSNCLVCNHRNKYNKYIKNYNRLILQKLESECESPKKYSHKKRFPSYIKCFNCQNLFQTQFHTINCDNYTNKVPSFKSCDGWQCVTCKKTYQESYSEFLDYIRNNHISSRAHKRETTTITQTQTQTQIQPENETEAEAGTGTGTGCQFEISDSTYNATLSRKKQMKFLTRCLSEGAKKEINNNYKTLYYGLQVKMPEGRLATIPPLAFLIDMSKPMSYYVKMIEDPSHSCLNVKTKYGSVNSRAKGGKSSIFRFNSLNKRYVGSARLVIVPRHQLQPDECILPETQYRRLICPKFVLCHRYPTLDIRSMTYHRVVGYWKYPCMAISTAVVAGNNADFDGDCLNVIPTCNLPSQAELRHLCHPRHNMIVQKKPRLKFDHDEIQTIFSQFGLNSTEIHQGIHDMTVRESSVTAYATFCHLRNFCHWVWENRTVPTINFKDFLEINTLFDSKKDYISFINNIYPQIKPHNGIKEMIASQSSRFSVDHLWQIFGEINDVAKTGFLQGMTRNALIHMAQTSRNAIMKDVAYHGYTHIKLTHCSQTIMMGYDGFLYTTDGVLVARRVSDLY